MAMVPSASATTMFCMGAIHACAACTKLPTDWARIMASDAAIAHLARPELTLPEIAQRLGFSEASTFHRAFKKWTGVAPGEYRLTRIGAAPGGPPPPAPATTGSP